MSIRAIPPIGALALLIVAVAVASVIAALAPLMVAPQIASAVLAAFCLGWPYLVVRDLVSAGKVDRSAARSVAIYFVVAEACIILLMAAGRDSQPGFAVLVNLLGLAAIVQVFYRASVALIEAEDGVQPPVNRCVGTFFAFFFLFFGIWSLQRRLRAVTLSEL